MTPRCDGRRPSGRFAGRIATAIDEQTLATDEMSENLAHISRTLELSADLAQALAVGADEVKVSVNDLAMQAERLVRSAGRFKT